MVIFNSYVKLPEGTPGFGDSQLRIPQALDKQRRELTNQVKTLKQEVPMTRRVQGSDGSDGQGEADWVHPFFRGQWAQWPTRMVPPGFQFFVFFWVAI